MRNGKWEISTRKTTASAVKVRNPTNPSEYIICKSTIGNKAPNFNAESKKKKKTET